MDHWADVALYALCAQVGVDLDLCPFRLWLYSSWAVVSLARLGSKLTRNGDLIEHVWAALDVDIWHSFCLRTLEQRCKRLSMIRCSRRSLCAGTLRDGVAQQLQIYCWVQQVQCGQASRKSCIIDWELQDVHVETQQLHSAGNAQSTELIPRLQHRGVRDARIHDVLAPREVRAEELQVAVANLPWQDDLKLNQLVEHGAGPWHRQHSKRLPLQLELLELCGYVLVQLVLLRVESCQRHAHAHRPARSLSTDHIGAESVGDVICALVKVEYELLGGQHIDLWLGQLRWQQEADGLLQLIDDGDELQKVGLVFGQLLGVHAGFDLALGSTNSVGALVEIVYVLLPSF